MLNNKIVALHFIEPCTMEFTEKLLSVWNSLTADQRDAFKIVIINKDSVNLSTIKAALRTHFKSIPWYVVEVCGRRLSRMFQTSSSETEYNGHGDLVVLKKDCYNHMSYFALNIMLKYGKNAYPFTLEKAVELEKGQRSPVVLKDILLPDEVPLRRAISSVDCLEVCLLITSLS